MCSEFLQFDLSYPFSLSHQAKTTMNFHLNFPISKKLGGFHPPPTQ